MHYVYVRRSVSVNMKFFAETTIRTKTIIDQLDEQGRWVENGRLRNDEQDNTTHRAIDSRTFINNVSALSTYLSAVR